MPERPGLYAAPAHISQVRKEHFPLQEAQEKEIVALSGVFAWSRVTKFAAHVALRHEFGSLYARCAEQ
jgi:hypothetical protein